MNRNAKYSIRSRTDYKIVLVDLWESYQDCLTITNDAVRVVAEINEKYPNREIWYLDIKGELTKLNHKNGIFTHFSW